MNISFFSNENVVIHGAGTAGAYIAQLISDSGGMVLAFVDDDREHLGKKINGINVEGSLEQVAEFSALVSFKVVVAMPSASSKTLWKVCKRYFDSGFDVFLLPTFEELVSGKKKLADIIPFGKMNIDTDLDGFEGNYVHNQYKNKVVLVSGAAGSIGSELCKQLALRQVSKIIAVDNSEYGLYKLISDGEFNNAQSVCIEPKLGTACDANFIRSIFLNNSIDLIFHAAAYKHVPLVEDNVVEGVKNNIMSTSILVDAAINHNVKKFVLISTDKAVRPTNVMGASKHVAELIIKRAAKRNTKSQTPCVFSAVRFGNVIGSSGSVLPLFLRQIKAGGPLSVTSKEITRYFMSISEATNLVLNAGCFSNSGYVYLLDMGEPVKVYDLAERLVIMSGLIPVSTEPKSYNEIKIDVVGLRPGEKLYEELLVDGTTIATKHPKIFASDDINLEEKTFDQLLNSLENAITNYDEGMVIGLLSEMVSGSQLKTIRPCDDSV